MQDASPIQLEVQEGLEKLEVYMNEHDWNVPYPTTGPLGELLQNLRERREEHLEHFAEMDDRFPFWEQTERPNNQVRRTFEEVIILLKRFMDRVKWVRFPCRKSRSRNRRVPSYFVNEYLGHWLENKRHKRKTSTKLPEFKFMDAYFPLWDEPTRYYSERPRSQYVYDEIYEAVCQHYDDVKKARPEFADYIDWQIYCVCLRIIPDFKLFTAPQKPSGVFTPHDVINGLMNPYAGPPQREIIHMTRHEAKKHGIEL